MVGIKLTTNTLNQIRTKLITKNQMINFWEHLNSSMGSREKMQKKIISMQHVCRLGTAHFSG